MVGRGRSAGRSSCSKRTRRLTPSFFIGRSLSSSRRTRIAAFIGPSPKKVSLRSRGQYPPLGHEHAVLDCSLVPGLPRPRGDDDGAVVGGEVLVGAVDVGLVAAGAGDGASELVRDPQRGGAAEVVHHVDVRVDPVLQLLGLGRLGVGQLAGAEDGDEQLDPPQLARASVDQGGPLPGEVDEGLLAGAVHLAHRRPQPPRPLPVDLTELGVAVAGRMDLEVLLPEELQGDAVAPEFAVDVRTVGAGPIVHRRAAGKQPSRQPRVVELWRQRPAEAAARRPLQVAGHRARTDGAGLSDLPVGQALLVPES